MLPSRRGAVALEFAILAIPLFTWILFIFELSYDLFQQEALDYAVHGAVRQIQTGNASSLTSGAAFIADYVCGATKGLLECPNIWLRVAAVTDFAPPNTNGAVPMSGSTLDLSHYTNLAGANAGGSQTAPQPYCVASPSQPIMVSAVYVGPTFVGSLLPGLMSVTGPSGALVHATLSTAGFVTEPFPPSTTPPPGAPTGSSTTVPSC